MSQNHSINEDVVPGSVGLPKSATASISWWTRGGDPGPSYTSDKLDITDVDGIVSATYIRARFDPSYNPPFRSEEFTGELPLSKWRSLLANITAESIFDKHIAAENRSDLADALKDTIELVEKRRVKAKTFYELSDEDFAKSRETRNDILRFLVSHGWHRFRTPAQ